MNDQSNAQSTASQAPGSLTAEDVITVLHELRRDMQSMSARLEKVEGEERSSSAPSQSTPRERRTAQSATQSAAGSHGHELDFAHSSSWAERMEEQDEILQSMDASTFEEGDDELDAAGTKLFSTGERTESFLRQSFSAPVANSVRRQVKDRFGAPNLQFTASPHLDKVLRSRVPAAVKARDKELARLQALGLDAVGPLTRIVEDACEGRLTASDNMDAVQTALRLLGNFAAQCNRTRRTAVLTALNPRIVDMAEEDTLYHDAGINLFGDGFCRKAKERDDEMRALNNMSATGARRETGKTTKSSFFPRTDRRGGRQQPYPSNSRGKPRFPFRQDGHQRRTAKSSS